MRIPLPDRPKAPPMPRRLLVRISLVSLFAVPILLGHAADPWRWPMILLAIIYGVLIELCYRRSDHAALERAMLKGRLAQLSRVDEVINRLEGPKFDGASGVAQD